MGRPTAAPLIDRLIVETTSSADLSVGQIGELSEDEGQTCTLGLPLGRSVPGNDLTSGIKLLGRELRLMVRFWERHGTSVNKDHGSESQTGTDRHN